MASLSSLDSDSLYAPLPTPPSTCLLPPFSFPSSQASIPDLAYLALTLSCRCWSSRFLSSAPEACSDPRLSSLRYPSLCSLPFCVESHPSSLPSLRSPSLGSPKPRQYALFLPPRRWEHFVFGVVAPSTTPRNGGSFAFSLFSIAAAPRDWGFFNFFLPIVIARRVHLHVVVATPSIHSAPASCQIPRIAGRGPPSRLRSDVQIRSASSSAHAHWRHQICAIRRPPWRALLTYPCQHCVVTFSALTPSSSCPFSFHDCPYSVLSCLSHSHHCVVTFSALTPSSSCPFSFHDCPYSVLSCLSHSH
ncbi:unnamed protein product, partial [Closterium sp. NIES-65]